jgi:hypothetical protein
MAIVGTFQIAVSYRTNLGALLLLECASAGWYLFCRLFWGDLNASKNVALLDTAMLLTVMTMLWLNARRTDGQMRSLFLATRVGTSAHVTLKLEHEETVRQIRRGSSLYGQIDFESPMESVIGLLRGCASERRVTTISGTPCRESWPPSGDRPRTRGPRNVARRPLICGRWT